MGNNDLLTVSQVAERRNISIPRVHQLIADGTLKAKKYGSYYLIKAEDADAVKLYGKSGRPMKEKAAE